MVDNVPTQLQTAAAKAAIDRIFGPLIFDEHDMADLAECAESDVAKVRFANGDGPVGIIIVDLYDSGSPEDAGLTVGLRGWHLNADVASI